MLTQVEADTLIAMRKRFLYQTAISVPAGTDETRELIGEDPQERFLLDIWRGTLRLSKVRLQTRGRKVVVLVRVDVDGAPHTNPDGERLGGTHIHLYRQGYDDKWAYPLDPSRFRDPRSIRQVFEDFCHYCNMMEIPSFQESLL